MGLHHRHSHGHLFVGEEARKYLDLRKRDSHGDSIVMNVPAGFPPVAQKDVIVETVVSHVFVTEGQSPTPSPNAPNAVPATADSVAQTAQSPEPARQTADSSPQQFAPSSVASVTRSRESAPSPTSRVEQFRGTTTESIAGSVPTSIITDAASAPESTHYDAPSNTQFAVGSSYPSSSLGDASSNDSGASNAPQEMSAGVKIGIAVGAVLGLVLLGALIFFCVRRRKNSNQPDEPNEKHDSIFGARQAVPEPYNTAQLAKRSSSTAPRLSLRPVTQFLPNLAENRKSGDILGGVASKSAWERRASPTENPFSDSATQEKARPETPTNANPFDERQMSQHKAASTSPNGQSPPSAQSQGNDQRSAAAASGRVSPPAQRGPNNVHRVQLDFKPSMDDELELRSGQLVRMLHEYDDGWALCVRMDRSQQGVCPRTCLSKLPVKPRQGPPPTARPQGPGAGPNPQGRAGGPNGMAPQSRSRMPAGPGARPNMPPALNANGMYPRPLTPTNSTERSESPDVLRQPVPGQAF